MTTFRAVLPLCLLVASACADDFDPPSRVQDLRVLAVRADTPFALPGSEVRLEALAHDPQERAVTWGWGTCLESASSIAIDCLRALRFESLHIGRDIPRHTLRVPDTDAPFLGIVTVACPGRIVAGDTEGVPLACVDEADRALPLSAFELGLKRVYLRAPNLNHNPEIAEVVWDGKAWPEAEVRREACLRPARDGCAAWSEHAVEVRAPGAVEQSVDQEGRPVTEQVVVQYYATAGEFDDDARVIARPGTTWRARAGDRGSVTLWFVVRDDRGGVSWTARSLILP